MKKTVNMAYHKWHTRILLCNGNVEKENNLPYNNLKLII